MIQTCFVVVLRCRIDTLRAREDEKQRFIDARIEKLKAEKLEQRSDMYAQLHKDSVKVRSRTAATATAAACPLPLRRRR